jgi:hypothetical protein
VIQTTVTLFIYLQEKTNMGLAKIKSEDKELHEKGLKLLKTHYTNLSKFKTRRDEMSEKIKGLGGKIPTDLSAVLTESKPEDGFYHICHYLSVGRVGLKDGYGDVSKALRSYKFYSKNKEVLNTLFGTAMGVSEATLVDFGTANVGNCDDSFIAYRNNNPSRFQFNLETISEQDLDTYTTIVEFLAASRGIYCSRYHITKLRKRMDEFYDAPTKMNIDHIRRKKVAMILKALDCYTGDESPLSGEKGYWGRRNKGTLISSDKVVPSALLAVTNSGSSDATVGYSIKSFQETMRLTGDKLEVDVGSRKAMVQSAKQMALKEAEEEGITVSEVHVAYAARKRELLRIYNSNTHTDENSCFVANKLDPVYNRGNPLEVKDEDLIGQGIMAPGLMLTCWAGDMTGKLGYYARQNRVVRDPSANGGWDIDETADAYVNAELSLTDVRFAKAQATPVQEKRYLASYTSDSGQTIRNTGTSPKRALANIRRRIRTEILDTLDIF